MAYGPLICILLHMTYYVVYDLTYNRCDVLVRTSSPLLEYSEYDTWYNGIVVLRPSQNSCPTSIHGLNRENSGIAPKRHTIRNLLNEHYPSMYMM